MHFTIIICKKISKRVGDGLLVGWYLLCLDLVCISGLPLNLATLINKTLSSHPFPPDSLHNRKSRCFFCLCYLFVGQLRCCSFVLFWAFIYFAFIWAWDRPLNLIPHLNYTGTHPLQLMQSQREPLKRDVHFRSGETHLVWIEIETYSWLSSQSSTEVFLPQLPAFNLHIEFIFENWREESHAPTATYFLDLAGKVTGSLIR